MTETFYWQAAALFWAAFCLFRVGAMTKGIDMTLRAWIDISQAAGIVVMVFALLTDGRGFLNSSTAPELGAACLSDDC